MIPVGEVTCSCQEQASPPHVPAAPKQQPFQDSREDHQRDAGIAIRVGYGDLPSLLCKRMDHWRGSGSLSCCPAEAARSESNDSGQGHTAMDN